jgi:hypothetical protein
MINQYGMIAAIFATSKVGRIFLLRGRSDGKCEHGGRHENKE